ncbi:hypothetical protein CCACVL1_30418 [Corchorus capsularis]|uniref:Uncharacterized protein n=1 Tax=Corchorus capsularis TaxID=210143 RepID=A0A1R3FXA7_COCAP|nr:hypothetical protein CCACVL1_30418 [Corchorus capsularis]
MEDMDSEMQDTEAEASVEESQSIINYEKDLIPDVECSAEFDKSENSDQESSRVAFAKMFVLEELPFNISTWTSRQKVSYLCLTAHFIDEDWKLHRKILNFFPVSNHEDEEIGRLVEWCLSRWKIKNVATVTVGNSGFNGVALLVLKNKLHRKGSLLFDDEPEVKTSLARIRDAVRWTSTYSMIRSALNFQKAFELLEDEDPKFVNALTDRAPTIDDWNKARSLLELLKMFYDASVELSGSHVTSNLIFKFLFEKEFEGKTFVVELLKGNWTELIHADASKAYHGRSDAPRTYYGLEDKHGEHGKDVQRLQGSMKMHEDHGDIDNHVLSTKKMPFDPLKMLIGPMTRARAKRFKVALMGLVQTHLDDLKTIEVQLKRFGDDLGKKLQINYKFITLLAAYSKWPD